MTAVANHIFENRNAIGERILNNVIDYGLFELIAKMDYLSVKNIYDNKNMNRIDSFASKYLSFCKPDTYPIMDRMVKMAIGDGYNMNDYISYYSRIKMHIETMEYVIGKQNYRRRKDCRVEMTLFYKLLEKIEPIISKPEKYGIVKWNQM